MHKKGGAMAWEAIDLLGVHGGMGSDYRLNVVSI
jgi:hypothetical protein